jgi:hypothetical protein
VVAGQRILQAASDIFLGWATGPWFGKHYYVRQLRDMKGSVDISLLSPLRLTLYASVCGWALARAHARSGEAAKIAGYLGTADTFDRAVEQFALAYATQAERDHAAFVAALRERGEEPSRAAAPSRARGPASNGSSSRRR